MTTQAIILVLISACLHASWNLLSKTGSDPVRFMMKALGYCLLAYAPLFVAMALAGYAIPAAVLPVLLASGLCTGLYFFALSKAYAAGHVSTAYPVARSFPIIVVMWAGLVWGERPSVAGLIGVLLVVAGSFILPAGRFVIGPDGYSLKSYANWSTFWALVAAAFTAGFSLLDKLAAVTLPSSGLGEYVATRVSYVYVQQVIAYAAFVAALFVFRVPAGRVREGRAFAAGLIFLISYSLILLAFTTDPAAYVVSFRQISIVITAVLSMLIIEREFSWPRLVGAGVIFAGVVLVGLSG